MGPSCMTARATGIAGQAGRTTGDQHALQAGVISPGVIGSSRGTGPPTLTPGQVATVRSGWLASLTSRLTLIPSRRTAGRGPRRCPETRNSCGAGCRGGGSRTRRGRCQTASLAAVVGRPAQGHLRVRRPRPDAGRGGRGRQAGDRTGIALRMRWPGLVRGHPYRAASGPGPPSRPGSRRRHWLHRRYPDGGLRLPVTDRGRAGKPGRGRAACVHSSPDRGRQYPVHQSARRALRHHRLGVNARNCAAVRDDYFRRPGVPPDGTWTGARIAYRPAEEWATFSPTIASQTGNTLSFSWTPPNATAFNPTAGNPLLPLRQPRCA